MFQKKPTWQIKRPKISDFVKKVVQILSLVLMIFFSILGFPGLPTNVLNATVLTASGQPVQFTQGGPQKLIVTQHAGGQPRLIVPAQQVALLSNGTVSTTHGAAPGGATIGQYDYLII